MKTLKERYISLAQEPKVLKSILALPKSIKKTRIVFPRFMKPQLNMGGEAAKFELPMSQKNEISN